ncbi:hypothetical protein FAM09_09150 [Niastella caeni]|uniref:DUF928 domain-containing protein n=1 Tax=Niastella caeni TaxID=2569763 RepID=A0A4S8I2F5_9BACT|nr:hypothetical protein [Niastella caeni]THU40042.1 hypothetical protein FAM09_09150 [Niastella caeni]
MKLIYLIITGLFFVCPGTYAQFVFFFQPEIYGRTVDGLGSFQVQNLTGAALRGQVVITVQETVSKTPVVTITTPVTNIQPGTVSFPRNVFSGSLFKFSSNAYANITNQTKKIPPGQYAFCYQFINADKGSDDYENCFDAEIQPLVPLALIYPADGDKICQKRPVLSWQPPIPFSSSMRFRLLLTEKREGEGVENLLVNAPLLLLDNITTTSINYPSGHPDLKEGKTYVWQVIAYQSNVVMSRSEIWEFTVQCTEPGKQMPTDSYRELKLLVNGNYYIANRALKFSFRNNYSIKRLSYAIYDIGKGMKKLKDCPEVLLTQGLNKVDIDLTEMELEPGKQYLLKVHPFNEPNIEVRFIYQDKDIEP